MRSNAELVRDIEFRVREHWRLFNEPSPIRSMFRGNTRELRMPLDQYLRVNAPQFEVIQTRRGSIFVALKADWGGWPEVKQKAFQYLTPKNWELWLVDQEMSTGGIDAEYDV